MKGGLNCAGQFLIHPLELLQRQEVSSPPEVIRAVLSISSSSLCSVQPYLREEMSQFIL